MISIRNNLLVSFVECPNHVKVQFQYWDISQILAQRADLFIRVIWAQWNLHAVDLRTAFHESRNKLRVSKQATWIPLESLEQSIKFPHFAHVFTTLVKWMNI